VEHPLNKFKAGTAVLCCLVLLSVFIPPAQGLEGKTLAIVFTHDMHSNFLPQRVSENGIQREIGGYARLDTLIEQQRQAHPGDLLVLDAGDFSMGTLFHTAFETQADDLRMLGRMGYDVTTLGNHEFDFHSQGLARMLNTALASGDRLPELVVSNMSVDPAVQDLVEALKNYPAKEYTVLDRGGLRIGIFGLMGKQAAEDIAFAPEVTFTDPLEAARSMVSLLKDQEKVDVIIALSHAGTQPDPDISEDMILASQVEGIDVIISGHTHTLLKEPIHIGQTWIVSSGDYGKYLGDIELDFSQPGGSSLVKYAVLPVTSDLLQDPEIASVISADQAEVEKDFLQPYGLTMNQAVADLSYDMDSLETIFANPGETGLGNLIADAFLDAARRAAPEQPADLAIEPIGVIRSSLVAGQISVSNIFNVLSLGLGPDGKAGFPLVAFYLNPEEIRQTLEVETTLSALNSDYHLQVSGLRFTWNPHRMPLDRVTSVEIQQPDGSFQPLQEGRLYKAVLNYYTAASIGLVSSKSYGILSITPKGENGQPLADIRQAIIDGDPDAPGVQEIKEWAALYEFIRAFPDANGNGLPDIPNGYQQYQMRNQPQTSWNPFALLSNATPLTWSLLGVALVFLALLLLLVWGGYRLVRRLVRR
jgi:2',3'-cyclic-nucleotide 2'-phosphodiesterase (5'-nucleotidase family)